MSAKKIGMVLGIIFIIVGLLGLVGGLGLGLVGANGIFMTNTAHDLVHLVTGILFVFVSMKAASSMTTVFKIFGIVYLLVALLGFWMGSPVLGFLDTNAAANWLHVVLGVVILGSGFMASGRGMMNGGGMA